MAKQNVSFVERHLEKMVVGVCAAVLLAVAWLYVVNSPNTMEVGGEALGPSQYYARFEEEAISVAERVKRAELDPSIKKPPPPAAVNNPSPYGQLGGAVPDQLGVAFASPSPAVPEVTKDGIIRGDLALAEVLPPLRPVLSTGHSSAKLPEPRVETVGSAETPPPAASLAAESRDLTWVTVLSAVDRKAQREAWLAAKYHERRLALIVTQVQAERQELLPDGQWGPAEQITGFAEWSITGPTTLQLSEETREFPPEQLLIGDDYRKRFEQYDKEAVVLRPPFQALIDEWWQWTTPKRLPGHDDIDMEQDYGVAFRPETTGKPGAARPPAGARPRPGQAAVGNQPELDAPQPGRGPNAEDAADAAASRRLVEALREADKAEKAKDWIQLEQVLEPVVSAKKGPKALLDKAQKLLDDHETDIQDAKNLRAEKERQKAARAALFYGPDIDPLWLTDITVVPGKTYRYRVRVLALNPYAGTLSYLSNLEDSCRLVLTGQWSEWSEAITAKPDRHLFFSNAPAEAGGPVAQVEIVQWSPGPLQTSGAPAASWKTSNNVKLTVGQAVAAGSGKSRFSYDGIIAGIALKVPHKSRLESKSGAFSYRDVETAALTLINSRGEVEERLAAVDQERKQKFQKERVEEQRLRDELFKVARPDFKPKSGQPSMSPSQFQPQLRGDERPLLEQ